MGTESGAAAPCATDGDARMTDAPVSVEGGQRECDQGAQDVSVFERGDPTVEEYSIFQSKCQLFLLRSDDPRFARFRARAVPYAEVAGASLDVLVEYPLRTDAPRKVGRSTRFQFALAAFSGTAFLFVLATVALFALSLSVYIDQRCFTVDPAMVTAFRATHIAYVFFIALYAATGGMMVWKAMESGWRAALLRHTLIFLRTRPLFTSSCVVATLFSGVAGDFVSVFTTPLGLVLAPVLDFSVMFQLRPGPIRLAALSLIIGFLRAWVWVQVSGSSCETLVGLLDPIEASVVKRIVTASSLFYSLSLINAMFSKIVNVDLPIGLAPLRPRVIDPEWWSPTLSPIADPAARDTEEAGAPSAEAPSQARPREGGGQTDFVVRCTMYGFSILRSSGDSPEGDSDATPAAARLSEDVASGARSRIAGVEFCTKKKLDPVVESALGVVGVLTMLAYATVSLADVYLVVRGARVSGRCFAPDAGVEDFRLQLATFSVAGLGLLSLVGALRFVRVSSLRGTLGMCLFSIRRRPTLVISAVSFTVLGYLSTSYPGGFTIASSLVFLPLIDVGLLPVRNRFHLVALRLVACAIFVFSITSYVTIFLFSITLRCDAPRQDMKEFILFAFAQGFESVWLLQFLKAVLVKLRDPRIPSVPFTPRWGHAFYSNWKVLAMAATEKTNRPAHAQL